jgi:hypothetical protein
VKFRRSLAEKKKTVLLIDLIPSLGIAVLGFKMETRAFITYLSTMGKREHFTDYQQDIEFQG